MYMTKRELIDILTDEYINSYSRREDSHYYMFQRRYEYLLNIIRMTTNATAIKAHIYDMLPGLPYVVEQSLLEFVDPFVNKTEDEIKSDPELNKIISERILKLAKDPKEEEEKSSNSKTVNVNTNASASKVKTKSNTAESNNQRDIFDIFNTF